MSATRLDIFQAKLCGEVRTKKRMIYAKNGMLVLRYCVQKHFFCVAKIDIINDSAFKSGNKTFAAYLVSQKCEAKVK